MSRQSPTSQTSRFFLSLLDSKGGRTPFPWELQYARDRWDAQKDEFSEESFARSEGGEGYEIFADGVEGLEIVHACMNIPDGREALCMIRADLNWGDGWEVDGVQSLFGGGNQRLRGEMFARGGRRVCGYDAHVQGYFVDVLYVAQRLVVLKGQMGSMEDALLRVQASYPRHPEAVAKDGRSHSVRVCMCLCAHACLYVCISILCMSCLCLFA